MGRPRRAGTSRITDRRWAICSQSLSLGGIPVCGTDHFRRLPSGMGAAKAARDSGGSVLGLLDVGGAAHSDHSTVLWQSLLRAAEWAIAGDSTLRCVGDRGDYGYRLRARFS